MPKRREDANQWLPETAKRDEECTIPEIWSRYHKQIAKFRDFQNVEDTIASYTATLKVIESALNTPASLMTAYDCLEAVLSVLYRTKGVHAGEPYASSTLQTRMTIIKDIYKYLEARAICMDPLWMTPWEAVSGDEIDWTRADKIREDVCRRGTKKQLRALTIEQERKLVRLIRQNFDGPEGELDGRWFGLALYLYLGLRPSEGRGLYYRNCRQFCTNCDRRYVNIVNSADAEGKIKDRVKSKNGVRRIPVHIELEMLIQKWVKNIYRLTGKADISDYPMICVGTDFEHPCSATAMAVFSKQVLQRVVPVDDLREMAQALYGEDMQRTVQDRKVEKACDYALSTRLYRRNFITKLYAETTLLDRDIRLCVGHDREYDDTTIADYAEDKVLVRMRAMDKRMIDASLRTDWFAQIGLNSGMECTGCGEYFFCVSREDAKHGMDIRILAENMEPGTDLVVELQRKLPPGATIEVESWTVPAPDAAPHRLDTTLGHWRLGWPKRDD